jgi:transposase InsO family protein
MGGDPSLPGQPQAGPAADAVDGAGGCLSAAEQEQAGAENRVYPYLLGVLSIARVNQVWCADITYILMVRGFVYLVVIMDWVSHAVLGRRLSDTLGTDLCVEVLGEALAQYGRPEIFNTDQRCQSQHRIQQRPRTRRHHDEHGWQGPLHGTISSSSGCGESEI